MNSPPCDQKRLCNHFLGVMDRHSALGVSQDPVGMRPEKTLYLPFRFAIQGRLSSVGLRPLMSGIPDHVSRGDGSIFRRQPSGNAVDLAGLNSPVTHTATGADGLG